MYTLITLVSVFSIFGYHCVFGATCKTDQSCQATDYTNATCTNNVCDCINSTFAAIRTGCALKLDKPVIIAMAGMSNQVVNGRPFTLTCNLADGAAFEWYQGSNKLSTKTEMYTATASAIADVGSFTCKGATADGVLTSESSNPFTVEMLGGTGGKISSSTQPTIVVPTTTAIAGSTITLSCNNIPMGSATTDVLYKVNGAAVTNPVTIDSNNAGKDVTCTIADAVGNYTFSSGTSAAGKLPNLITNIQSVAVTWAGQTLTEIDKGHSSTLLLLTCTTTPSVAYLGTSPTYAWQKDGVAISSATAQSYIVNSPGTFSCTATLSGQSAVASGNKVEVTFRNDQLKTSSSQPIKGGRVILTCGDVRYDGATYQWAKDSIGMGRQYDRKLQIDNFDTSDNGNYECRILLNGFILDTYSLTLTSQTTIATPTIFVGGCGSRLSESGDYWLSCETNSETIGMTYEWTVNGVVSTGVTGKYYNLPAVSISNNGNYTCKAKFTTYTSATSDIKHIIITDPGLYCYHDNVCIAAKIGYNGKCDHNDRCMCAEGFVPKGEKCISTSKNGEVKVISSLAILVLAYATTKFI